MRLYYDVVQPYFDVRFGPEHINGCIGDVNVSWPDCVCVTIGSRTFDQNALWRPVTKSNTPHVSIVLPDQGWLPERTIAVNRSDGVRVYDVYDAIHKAYQPVLTPSEKAGFSERAALHQPFYEERVRLERSRNPSYIDPGMRRVDLLGKRVIYSGCDVFQCMQGPNNSVVTVLTARRFNQSPRTPLFYTDRGYY